MGGEIGVGRGGGGGAGGYWTTNGVGAGRREGIIICAYKERGPPGSGSSGDLCGGKGFDWQLFLRFYPSTGGGALGFWEATGCSEAHHASVSLGRRSPSC